MIIQHLTLDGFDSAHRKDFFSSREKSGREVPMGPLEFRHAFREVDEIDPKKISSGEFPAYFQDLKSKKKTVALAGWSVPIIYVGCFTLPQSSAYGNQGDGTGQPGRGRTRSYERDLLFLDSSIWHRFVSLQPGQRLISRLLRTISDVRAYWNEGLYRTEMAVEYLDYAVRALRAERLFTKKEHGAWVSLHGFSSEWQAEKNAKEPQGALCPQRGDNGDAEVNAPHFLDQCRFLLVDDFAEESLSGYLGADTPTKSQVIHRAMGPVGRRMHHHRQGAHDILSSGDSIDVREKQLTRASILRAFEAGNRAGRNDEEENRADVLDLESAGDIEEAENKLRGVAQGEQNMYDIVLLDYLLGRDGDHRPRRLGTELVSAIESEDINGDESLNGAKGPCHKFWIFPVSAFSRAFVAEMEQGNVRNIDTRYITDSGADPLCTPHLFRLKLLRFMKAQRDEAGGTLEQQCESLADEILDIFPAHNQDESNWEMGHLREQAARKYPDAVRRHNRIMRLQKDADAGSKMAASLLHRPEEDAPDVAEEQDQGAGQSREQPEEYVIRIYRLVSDLLYSLGYDTGVTLEEKVPPLLLRLQSTVEKLGGIESSGIGDDALTPIKSKIRRIWNYVDRRVGRSG